MASARDTHRASALAVALRKLNASYARRTRDLDKARAHIAELRDLVYEAWKHAEEHAARDDKSEAAPTMPADESQELSSADPEDSVADDDNLYEDDTSSNVLNDVSGAEVVDVTGKAVAAQARLTMMRTDPHRPPPSSYSTRSLSSPISGSSTPQRPRSSSHTSGSRKRARRKSKASLRPSMPISVRSRSSTRGESGMRNARSKSRSKKER